MAIAYSVRVYPLGLYIGKFLKMGNRLPHTSFFLLPSACCPLLYYPRFNRGISIYPIITDGYYAEPVSFVGTQCFVSISAQ